MTRTLFERPRRALRHTLLMLLCATLGLGAAAQSAAPRGGDYIVAVVNQELVTNSEVQQRVASLVQEAQRSGARLPPAEALRNQVLNALIDDRAQLSHARDVGMRVDEAEVDRAVNNVAAQNQLTQAQLRERLAAQGIDYLRFRNNLRDQIMLQRLREREVQSRIRITEAEIEQFLTAQRGQSAGNVQYNIAQILVAVPEGASAEQQAERRARANQVLAQARSGTPFEQLAREYSDGANKDQGGAIGLRSADRLPDLFVEAVRELSPGDLATAVVRSGAGFHILKLLSRDDPTGLSVTQTRASHILLRLSPQLTQETALRRLADYRRRIESGQASFAQLARQHSEDGSASQGGDLGWASPGQFVPEFEEVMTKLAVGQVSEPFMSRFGAHLMQVNERRETRLDARQQRELATNALREQKFEAAYEDWAREIRERAYVELREPPQ